VPHLHAVVGGGLEDCAVVACSGGDEDAHDVFVGAVRVHSLRREHVEEPRQVALDAELVDAAGGSLQFVDRPLRRDLPLVHDDHVVAGVLDVGQQVRRQDQADVLVVPEIADELEHLVAAFRVHAVGRLVEEQQIGIVHQRLRQLDALLHARGVGVHVAVARLAEADVIEDLVRALHRVNGGQPGELAAVGDERDRVHAGNVRVVFRHVADARADGERRVRHVQPQHAHRPLVRLHEPEQRLQHRALAAPLGPSRPTAPRAKLAVTFLSAWFLP
jgi:hypothetical protein